MASPPILPEELISLILGNLSPREDRQAIRALRLCNKMFSRLATPFMWRKINIAMATPSNGVNTATYIERDEQLIEQLISNPGKTQFVKEVQLEHRSEGMSGEDRQALKQSVEEDDEDVEVAISNALKDLRRNDARAAFILLYCKDLAIVNWSESFHCLGELVQRLYKHAAARQLRARLDPSGKIQPPDFLASIREVTMDVGMSQTSVEDTRTLLCLPALCTLRLGNLADNHFFKERNPPPHDSIIRNTNPVQFIFDMCMMSPAGLDTILQTCPNAQGLMLRWRPGLWNDHFVNTEFCDLLRERGQHLEKIHFDCASMLEHRFSMRPLGPYGSFASLDAEWLAVPKAFFNHLFELPAELRPAEAAALLPSGLKELYVIGVEEEEMGDMYAVVGKDAIGEAMNGLEKSVCVPWFHFSLEEHFGTVHHRNVDYDKTGRFEFDNMR